MIKIGITQRVVQFEDQSIDRLDNEWIEFLKKCKFNFQVIPNDKTSVNPKYLESFTGIILSGGNSLISCGGDAPIRDIVEKKILSWAVKKNIPVLGVCRGMQVIQEVYGLELKRVYGHVRSRQIIKVGNYLYSTNSYHNFGTKKTSMNLKVFACSDDGVVKGIYSRNKKILAIMWHPERMTPFNYYDINLFKNFFRDI